MVYHCSAPTELRTDFRGVLADLQSFKPTRPNSNFIPFSILLSLPSDRDGEPSMRHGPPSVIAIGSLNYTTARTGLKPDIPRVVRCRF